LRKYRNSLKFISAFFSLVIIALMVLIWRLSHGPVAMDWFAPYIKTALSNSLSDVEVNFQDVVLTWQPSETAYRRSAGLELRLLNITAFQPGNNLILDIPQADIKLSGLGLLRGLIAPTSVEVSNLSLDISLPKEIWESQSDLSFAEQLQLFLDDVNNSDDMLLKALRDFVGLQEKMNTAGYLQGVRLVDTNLTIFDEASGQSWKIPKSVLDIRRDNQAINLFFDGAVNVPDQKGSSLTLMVSHDRGQEKTGVNLDFSNLQLAHLSNRVDALSGGEMFDLPFAGTINFTVLNDLTISKIKFDLNAGQGKMNPGNLYDQHVAVDQMIVAGNYDSSEKLFAIEQLYAQFADTIIKGDGLIHRIFEKDDRSYDLHLSLDQITFRDLLTYWPKDKGGGARKWIDKNISEGDVYNGELKLSLTDEILQLDRLPKSAIKFTFDYKNMVSTYLGELPELRNAKGFGQLDSQTFKVSNDRGELGKLSVPSAKLLFTDIDLKAKAHANIEVGLSGELPDIMYAIDQKPLQYPSLYDIKTDSILGDADVTLKLSFPLIKDLSLKDVFFDVFGDISKFSIPELTNNLSIDDGTLTLSVKPSGILASGNIILNDVPLAAEWTENFAKEAEFSSIYQIQGTMEGSDWGLFQLPFEPYIEGPAEVSLTLKGKGAKISDGNGKINLLNTTSRFDPLGWVKEKGEQGTFEYDITFEENDQIKIRNAQLQSEGLFTKVDLDLNADVMSRLILTDLKQDKTNINLSLEWQEQENHYIAKISGPKLDGAPIIDILTSSNQAGEENALPDFVLTGYVDALNMQNGVSIGETNISLKYKNNDPQEMFLVGSWETDKQFSISIAKGNEDRIIKITTNDAGEMLRGMGMFALASGGEMILDADMVRQEKGLSITGKTKIDKVKVVDSPGFSALLAEKKFDKAREELKNAGLSFNKFDMKFNQYDGILKIDEAVAKGSTLGVVFAGNVDQSYDEMNIKGTIVPAYGLNSFLGNIPLLGPILTGGKNEGIFSATFKVSGSAEEPDISVNPLSALAPGILRKLFSSIGGGEKKSLREVAEEMQDIAPDVQQKDPAPEKPEQSE